ncbi:VerA protein [Apiospora arundinis]|uniref:VerA protein n=1 Tax=Apiospora arundinis TaxID=335852 RepID=A0ABR2JMR8_9PEZI
MSSFSLPEAAKASWGILWRVVVALSIYALSKFLFRAFTIRTRFRHLARTGIPMLPHSWLLGHLPIVAQLKKDLPPDISFILFHGWLASNVKKYFPDLTEVPPVVYLDMWPFLKDPVVVVFDATASADFMSSRTLQKHPITKDFLRPLTEGLDILSSHGELWKKWRSAFNPGFSPRNIISLIPELLYEMQVFSENMEKRAGKDGAWSPVFQLQSDTTKLTLDVIFRASVGNQLGEQSSVSGSPLKLALLDQIHEMEAGGDVARSFFKTGFLPWRRMAVARNNRIMENQLLPDIEKTLTTGNSEKEKITLLNQALKSVEAATGQKINSISSLDAISSRSVICNLKVLLLAGFETTSGFICWIFKELQDNPACMEKLRSEHDEVLGTDADQATRLLKESPHLLNSLPYTNAVVKEVLRMYPLTFAIREGTPDYFLRVPGSPIKYPTDKFGIWDAIGWTQRNPALWPEPDSFIPERWLVAQDHRLHPRKDAFRTFGLGQRNCIGQELATVEAKLVLILCARKFDIEEAWEKWDAQHPHDPKYTVRGQRLYPAGLGTMHPKDHMPVHVRLRKPKEAAAP